jgi:hypothetical protein
VDPITLIGAISTVLNITDQISNQLDRFKNDEPEPEEEPPHSIIATRERPDTIIVRRYGDEVERITSDDLAKLDRSSQGLIKAFEESMDRHYQLWITVYPKRDQSPDPMVNAQVNQQLKETAKRMCSDLGHILGYLDSLGKDLQDHYAHVRYVCSDLEEM